MLLCTGRTFLPLPPSTCSVAPATLAFRASPNQGAPFLRDGELVPTSHDKVRLSRSPN